jgi:NAD(P)-dependent dehydrogenase (short-subunit alcohol dehydrogenase family)
MSLNPALPAWPLCTVWLIGASTGIGRATAAALHARGAQVIVSARDAQALSAFTAQHPGSIALPLDVTDAPAMHRAHDQALGLARRNSLDLVLYCAGHYHPMRVGDFNLADARRHLQVNYEGVLNLLAPLLPTLQQQGHGHLSVVASVAGLRGLPKALAYGPTKAALINLAETLYLDLHELGVGVSVINPGFVQTPLTAGNDFAMPALLTPEQAALAMIEGWAQRRFDIHFPRRFTWWLKLARHLPDSWYFPAIRRVTGQTGQ